MDASQAQQKAKTILKQDGLDQLLVIFYLAVKHFPSWVSHQNFESELNIGVTSVGTLKEEISVGYEAKEVVFTTGLFNGVKFKVGGDSYFTSYPDGETAGYEIIRFGIGEDLKTAVEAKFSLPETHSPCLPSDYSLFAGPSHQKSLTINDLQRRL